MIDDGLRVGAVMTVRLSGGEQHVVRLPPEWRRAELTIELPPEIGPLTIEVVNRRPLRRRLHWSERAAVGAVVFVSTFLLAAWIKGPWWFGAVTGAGSGYLWKCWTEFLERQ